MKADGLTPFAFTDKDGWPAMGTFDIINMRINGYEFHVGLMARQGVVEHRPGQGRLQPVEASSCRTTRTGALGLTWQEGAQQLVNKQAGMFLLGSFVGQQFTNPADHADLDFFPYPSINPKWGQDSLDAPIDGFMMSKKPRNARRQEAARLPRQRRGCRTYLRPTRTTRRPTRTRARRTTARCSGKRRG